MRGRFDSVALVGALLALTACDLLQPAPPDAGLPIAELDMEPRAAEGDPGGQAPTGPVVQFATGEVQGARFHLVVHRSAGGVCTSVQWENGGGGGCGALPGGTPQSESFGTISLGGDGVTRDLTGIVAAEVDAVSVELESGARARTVLLPLEAAELDANAFMAFVPVDAVPVAVLALDGSGDVVERFEIGPAPLRDGPMPTAAAP